LAEYLLARAGGRDRKPPTRDLSIVLMDDVGMAAINDSLLGHEGPTDVITARYRPIPGETEAGDIGELYVNVDRAVDEAEATGRWSPSRELALYIAHGCDHLAGEDDASPAQQKRMRRRELKWLQEAEAAGFSFEGLIGQ